MKRVHTLAGDLVFVDRAPTTPHADIERWRITLANSWRHSARLTRSRSRSRRAGRARHRADTPLARDHQPRIKDAFEKGLDIAEATALPLPDWTQTDCAGPLRIRTFGDASLSRIRGKPLAASRSQRRLKRALMKRTAHVSTLGE